MRKETSFLDILKSLLRTPSVVGCETAFFRELKRELEERNATVTWYHGLLVAQGTKPESFMISAHADRHGLMCTGPNEFQYAAFIAGRRSDLLGNSVSEALMRKIVRRFDNKPVIAYDPWSGSYQGAGTITNTYVCEYRNNLIFEISDLEHLTPGTPVAFQDRLTVTESYLSGQLDNVITIAHLVHLFDLGFQGTLFFTAQEESGSSWRFLMEWFLRHNMTTDRLIVVDTSPFQYENDDPMPDIVLRKRDANATFSLPLAEELAQCCEHHQYQYLFKDTYIDQLNQQAEQQGEDTHSIGSTELGRIINASNGSIQGTTLQIPTTGYHTMNETATLRANHVFGELLHRYCGLL